MASSSRQTTIQFPLKPLHRLVRLLLMVHQGPEQLVVYHLVQSLEMEMEMEM